jgi:hypothetical protein
MDKDELKKILYEKGIHWLITAPVEGRIGSFLPAGVAVGLGRTGLWKWLSGFRTELLYFWSGSRQSQKRAIFFSILVISIRSSTIL